MCTRTKACNERARLRARRFVVVLGRAHSIVEHAGTCEHSRRKSMGYVTHQNTDMLQVQRRQVGFQRITVSQTCELLRQSKLLKNPMDLHLRRQLAIMIPQCIHLRCMRLPHTNHLKVLMVIRIQHEWRDPQRHRVAHKLIDAILRFPTLVLGDLIQSSSDGETTVGYIS
jgi:hypothetical protein